MAFPWQSFLVSHIANTLHHAFWGRNKAHMTHVELKWPVALEF